MHFTVCFFFSFFSHSRFSCCHILQVIFSSDVIVLRQGFQAVVECVIRLKSKELGKSLKKVKLRPKKKNTPAVKTKKKLQLVDEDVDERPPGKRRKTKAPSDVGSSVYAISKEERMSTRLKFNERKINLKILLFNCVVHLHSFCFGLF